MEFRDLFFDSMVSGVWAGDVHKMSVSATLPLLKQLEAENGSVLRALMSHQSKSIEAKTFSKKLTTKALFSFKNGIQVLIDALENKLKDSINYNVHIDSIHFSDQVKLVVNGQSHFFDELVSSIPSYSISRYLGSELKNILNSINYSPIAVLNMKLSKSEINFDGFGFLVPSRENSVVLGMVANCNIFPEHASNNFIINTVMMGGSRYSIKQLKSFDLKQEAQDFLEGVFNKKLNIDMQELMIIEKSIPQYELGHLGKVKQLEKLCPPNLTLIGNYMYGVSLIDIILKSRQTAKELIS